MPLDAVLAAYNIGGRLGWADLVREARPEESADLIAAADKVLERLTLPTATPAGEAKPAAKPEPAIDAARLEALRQPGATPQPQPPELAKPASPQPADLAKANEKLAALTGRKAP